MTPTGYAVAAVAAGVLLVAITVLGLSRADETWRSHRRTCGRCRDAWIGTSKVCERCGGPGHTDPPAGGDHQGHVDTGPIPAVPAPRPPSDARARHRLIEKEGADHG